MKKHPGFLLLPGQMVLVAIALILISSNAIAQNTGKSQDKSYMEEWVYRVKYGFKDEWWKLFQKNQLAVLNKEKELGYITSYTDLRTWPSCQ